MQIVICVDNKEELLDALNNSIIAFSDIVGAFYLGLSDNLSYKWKRWSEKYSSCEECYKVLSKRKELLKDIYRQIERSSDADQIVIEIPEVAYETCKSVKNVESEQGNFADLMLDAIAKGTPIPDNATNADVIRTLFPNGIPKDIVWTLQDDKGADWWNAPYQKGGKE